MVKIAQDKRRIVQARNDELEVQHYLACIDGIRPDLDIRIIINFQNHLQHGTEQRYFH